MRRQAKCIAHFHVPEGSAVLKLSPDHKWANYIQLIWNLPLEYILERSHSCLQRCSDCSGALTRHILVSIRNPKQQRYHKVKTKYSRCCFPFIGFLLSASMHLLHYSYLSSCTWQPGLPGKTSVHQNQTVCLLHSCLLFQEFPVWETQCPTARIMPFSLSRWKLLHLCPPKCTHCKHGIT